MGTSKRQNGELHFEQRLRRRLHDQAGSHNSRERNQIQNRMVQRTVCDFKTLISTDQKIEQFHNDHGLRPGHDQYDVLSSKEKIPGE